MLFYLNSALKLRTSAPVVFFSEFLAVVLDWNVQGVNFLQYSAPYREVEDGVGSPVLQCRQVVRPGRCLLLVIGSCNNDNIGGRLSKFFCIFIFFW